MWFDLVETIKERKQKPNLAHIVMTTYHFHILKTQNLEPETVLGKFLVRVGQDPSDSKSSWLHVDIFQFCFMHLGYTMDSSKMINNPPEVSSFNQLCLKLLPGRRLETS